MSFIPRESKQLVLVGGVAILGYALMWAAFGYGISDEVLFGSVDAKEYRAVGDWILHGTPTDNTLTRPYLYPLLLGISHTLGGAFGTWMMQALAWLTAVLAVFVATSRATGSVRVAWLTSGLVMSNLSFFALTFQALTETTTCALLALLVLFAVCYRKRSRSVPYFVITVLFLSLLSLLRPVFMPLLLVWLFVVGPLFHLREFVERPAALFQVLLALSLLLPQFLIMHQRHDHVGISAIGGATFRNYLFARSYAELEGLDLEGAQATVKGMSSGEMRSIMMDSPSTFIGLFATHLEDNLYYAGGYTLEMADGHEHPTGTWIMDRLNKLYCILHVIMLIPCLVVLVRYAEVDNRQALALGLSTILLILLSSGISFWQGDRLTLPTIVVWPLLYAWVIHLWRNRSANQKAVLAG